MNLLKTLLSPVTDITRAVVLPFKAVFVIGLTGTINAMTYHGVWWFKWVAFGMGIAVLVAFAKAARTLLLLALVAWVGTQIYKRYGQSAKAQFDDWVARTQPHAAQVLGALQTRATSTTNNTSTTSATPSATHGASASGAGAV